MLAKITSKNQLTLPKSVTQAVSGVPEARIKIVEELLLFVVHSSFPGAAPSSAMKNAHPLGRTILFGRVGALPLSGR